MEYMLGAARPVDLPEHQEGDSNLEPPQSLSGVASPFQQVAESTGKGRGGVSVGHADEPRSTGDAQPMRTEDVCR